jgi:hypothetical protein
MSTRIEFRLDSFKEDYRRENKPMCNVPLRLAIWICQHDRMNPNLRNGQLAVINNDNNQVVKVIECCR